MTVEELYARIGGDYAEAISRLRMDKLVARFVVKLLDDGSPERLVSAWAEGDEGATFEAAHTVKGVCGNLALTELFQLSNDITEALRPGNVVLRAQTDLDALVARFGELWGTTRDAIEEFRATA